MTVIRDRATQACARFRNPFHMTPTKEQATASDVITRAEYAVVVVCSEDENPRSSTLQTVWIYVASRICSQVIRVSCLSERLMKFMIRHLSGLGVA